MNASISFRPLRHLSRHLPRRLSRRESWLAAVAAFMLLLALLAPALTGAAAATPSFSDMRSLAGLPNAIDVLSNLPFLVLGMLGLYRLHQLERHHEQAHSPAHDELPGGALDCAWLFFAGLVLVAVASGFYHLHPDDAMRLAGDRAAMAVAFAGVIGLAVFDRVSQRAAWPAACVSLAGGLAAVAVFQQSGNVTPWAVVQFGGMALVLWMATLRPVRGSLPRLQLKLGGLIAAYAVAKVLELADAPVFELTGHLVSGHSLKHVVAAFAAVPVLQALHRLAQRPLVHNARAVAVTA